MGKIIGQTTDILLVGKPNAGKTSLFNLLTGLHQKVGNYAGVTVEIKSGSYDNVDVMDLPGLRSLRSVTPEEKISRDMILDAGDGEKIVFVASGSNLKDDLFLFSELADLQLPMLLVINFKDELDKHNIAINTHRISDIVGCPVVLVSSRDKSGIDELKHLIEKQGFKVPNSFCRSLYENVTDYGVDNIYRESMSNHSMPVDITLNEADYLKRQKIISSVVRI